MPASYTTVSLMSVTYLGSVNLLSLIPGLGASLGGLQKTIGSLEGFKADKKEMIDRALVEVEAMQNVFDQAKGLLDAGMGLMQQAEGVLGEARNIVTDLLGTIGGAGVGAYRFDGDVVSIGSELRETMLAHGQEGQITALILVASDGAALTAMRKLFKMD